MSSINDEWQDAPKIWGAMIENENCKTYFKYIILMENLTYSQHMRKTHKFNLKVKDKLNAILKFIILI